MSKFRKKPVVIEAFKYGVDPIPDWFMDKVSLNEIMLYAIPFAEGRENNYGQRYCHIKTLEGTMHGSEGDYIIQGVNGEIYPCKPDIFEKTYELPDSGNVNDIRLLQYENLRKCFKELLNDVLGKDYYNYAMDVYGCDEQACLDLRNKLIGQ